MTLRACDISRIRDWLYLGNQAAEKSPIQGLKELQITHVVQVGSSQFMSPSHQGLLKYCCVSALDHEGEDLLAILKQHSVHSFMHDARREGGVVLVHCFMKDEGLTYEDALADLISRRDCVAPNRGFCYQLKILQVQCGGKLEKYEPEMLTDYKEEMSTKQWLALLMRTREAGQLKSRGRPGG